MGIIDTIDLSRKKATKELDQDKRSELGQFLTPSHVAKFMAGLFEKTAGKEVHLLDAGAGVGSLSAAFLERVTKETPSLKLTAYEIDSLLVGYLGANLELYRDKLIAEGVSLMPDIRNIDFIQDASMKVISNDSLIYTHAILNPPYKKIHSNSAHRKYLRLTHFETVNLYSAFVGLSIKLLIDKGELVAIIPRSFCNGNYYKPFRCLILDETCIKRIHLFKSRTHAFKDDEVLQENIIIHLVKNEKQGEVAISSSTDTHFHDYIEHKYPFEQIVNEKDTEKFFRIPQHDIRHIEDSKAIRHTLQELSIQVSTGPVVDFRAKEYLLKNPADNAVPLLYPSHFNCKDIEWPVEGKKPNAIQINDVTIKMLYPKGFYTVVRRFSSKEEKQRIVARVINPEKLTYELIGIENHLNVLHVNKRGLSEDLAYGIAAYLNSGFVDSYFRSFNGHTQVNATDLKQMRYPSKQELAQLGQWAKKQESFDPEKIDKQLQNLL